MRRAERSSTGSHSGAAEGDPAAATFPMGGQGEVAGWVTTVATLSAWVGEMASHRDSARSGSAVVSHRAGLLRQRDFRLLWFGETVSKCGSAATDVALPLVAVTTLHASPLTVGVLGAATWLPYLLISLPAGAWVDRFPRRPVMVASNSVSALLFASVPVTAWLGRLTILHVLSVAFCTGLAKVFFRTAYQAYLPTIVGRWNLAEGNAKMQGSASAAEVTGPGLAGLMAQAFGASAALLADAISFLVSTACLRSIRLQEPPTQDPRRNDGLIRRIAAGLRYAVHDPYLRTLALYGSVGNLTLVAVQTLLIVFLIRVVKVGPGPTGLLMTSMGIGGILGAMLTRTIIRRYGTARGLLLTAAATTPAGLLLPLAQPGPRLLLFTLGLLVLATGIVTSNVIAATFRQSYCPPHILGRTSAVMSFLVFGTMPLGAIIAGLTAAKFGTATAMWILCAGLMLPALILVVSPIGRLRDLPTANPATSTNGG
jgi:predicted MFS family arabinose efflux permease